MEKPIPPVVSDENAEVKTPERDRFLKLEEGLEDAKKLQVLLNKYKDKRVLIVAPPGAGKSTLLQHIKEGIDMDGIFSAMTKEEKDFALQREYEYSDIKTRNIKFTKKEFIRNDPQSLADLRATSSFFDTYLNAHTKIEPGKPLFSTNVIDSDVIIYLKLSDDTYKNRLDTRSKNTDRPEQPERAFALKDLVEEKIATAEKNGVIVEEFEIN